MVAARVKAVHRQQCIIHLIVIKTADFFFVYQFRRSCRFMSSKVSLVCVRVASNSTRYCSTARCIRPTGNSSTRRPVEDCGRLASSIQSFRRTAMSDETACTFVWSLNGGTCNIAFSKVRARNENMCIHGIRTSHAIRPIPPGMVRRIARGSGAPTRRVIPLYLPAKISPEGSQCALEHRWTVAFISRTENSRNGNALSDG